MTSELSSGFLHDCCWFIQEFAKRESISFKVFMDLWKKHKFHYIFCFRKSDTEIVEFTSEILMIIKQIFLSSNSSYEKIGAFFTMYTIYFKQPAQQFCKIRFNLKDWIELKHFVQFPHPTQQSTEIQVIFWKMFKAEAFRHVYHDQEFGYDPFFVKQEHQPKNHSVMEQLKFQKTLKSIKEDCEELNSKTGMLKALEIIETGYNEMKELLQEKDPSNTEDIPQSSIVASLKKDLDGLMSFFNRNNVDSGDNEVDQAREMARRRNAIRRKAYRNEKPKKSKHRHGKESESEIEENSQPIKRKPSTRSKTRPPKSKKMLVNFTNESNEDNEYETSNIADTTQNENYSEGRDQSENSNSDDIPSSTNRKKSSKKQPKKKSKKNKNATKKNLEVKDKDLPSDFDDSDSHVDEKDDNTKNIYLPPKIIHTEEENYNDLFVSLEIRNCSINNEKPVEKKESLTTQLKNFRKIPKIPVKAENNTDILISSDNDIQQPSTSRAIKSPVEKKKAPIKKQMKPPPKRKTAKTITREPYPKRTRNKK